MSHFQDRKLKTAFEKAPYMYSEDTIDRSISVIQEYLYLYYPDVYNQYTYNEIREALIEYQKDKEIKWRISDYIINGEIIYTDRQMIMKELHIDDERYMFYIDMYLKVRERKTLNSNVKFIN